MGSPRRTTRDWLANLAANPQFILHLKHRVVADLPATATIILEPAERRRVLAVFVEEFNRRRREADDGWPEAVLDEWVAQSPLAKSDFRRGRLTRSPPVFVDSRDDRDQPSDHSVFANVIGRLFLCLLGRGNDCPVCAEMSRLLPPPISTSCRRVSFEMPEDRSSRCDLFAIPASPRLPSDSILGNSG